MELLEWVEKNNKNSIDRLKDARYFEYIFVGGICLLSLICAILYVLFSKTVYFWDDSTYWDIGRMLAEKPLGFGFLKDVYTSVGSSDYNYFVAVPVSLWMKIFGITRVSYITSVILFYLVPSQILIYVIAKKLSKAPYFAFLITLMIMPAMWYITVIGFIDVAGVMTGLVCYLLYLTDVLEKKPCLKNILLGVMLVFSMIIRRYFAFFTVSFITLMIVDTILNKHNYKQTLITLITVAVMLLTVFLPFFKNILLKDYGTLYAGYKYSIWTDMKLVARYFGVVFLVMIISFSVRNIIRRKERNTAFVLMQIAVCFLMFVSTQTHGQQHLLLYMPALAVLIIITLQYIKKTLAVTLVCVISLVNLLSPVIPRKQPQNIQEIKSPAAFPSYSVKPKKRDDINSIMALKRTLDKKIPEGEKCGIAASSFVLNSSILINVLPSLNIKDDRKDNYIVGLPEVDSRDYGRLGEIYSCEYILVAFPAQTHLAPGEQTIITQLVESFENDTDIACAYSEIYDFKFNINGIDVKLYKRSSDVSKTVITEFEMKLYK